MVIPATLTLETDPERISELFTDVADNAKGINATALARLDHRNVFNRVAAAIYEGADEWTLLQGLIDDDNAYVTQRTRTGPRIAMLQRWRRPAGGATASDGPRTRNRPNWSARSPTS
jgi:hypothetical protein